MSSLDSFEPGVKGIVYMKGIVKFLHMKTHLMIFSEMLIEKNPIAVFRKTAIVALSSDIEGYFHFENS